jgi:hypothetical protein
LPALADQLCISIDFGSVLILTFGSSHAFLSRHSDYRQR